jgi:hypothetical protein
MPEIEREGRWDALPVLLVRLEKIRAVGRERERESRDGRVAGTLCAVN